MPIPVTCQACQFNFQVKDEFAGKRGKCPKCQQVVQVPAAVMNHAPAAVVKTAPATAAHIVPMAVPVEAAPARRPSTAVIQAPHPTQPAAAWAKPIDDGKPSLRPEMILNAFQGEIEPVRVSLVYRLGIVVIGLTMLLLPLMYLGMIGLAGYGLFYHATHNASVFRQVRSARGAAIAYVGPLVAGGVMILFMIKPLFAGRGPGEKSRTLKAESEPLLFDFVERVCEAVGAPVPSQINVDCQVNASASFAPGPLSKITGKLVLTIGLPLVAGLNLRQFAGVLAHEFGHFAQRTGMRLTYLIRTINFWFLRVVYERDAWDQKLVEWSHAGNVYITVIMWVTRFMVWLTRRVLWVLMWLGNVLSCFMLRQMEFDADRYEARLAGSDTFESTARRLRILNMASMFAKSQLSDSWNEGRLADNLPALIVLKELELPAAVNKSIEESLADSKTGIFDTHPAESDRIASALAEESPGIFRLDAPAELLFHNFSRLCQNSTFDLYREVFGDGVKRERLYPVAEIERRHTATQEAHKAVRRFMGKFSSLRPLPLPGEPPCLPEAADATAVAVREARNRMRDVRAKYAAALDRYDKCDTATVQAETAGAMLKAKLRIKAEDFSLERASIDEAKAAKDQAAADIARMAPNLERFERDAAQRLHWALGLMHSRRVAETMPNAEEMLREVLSLYPVAVAVSGLVGNLVRLGHEQAALYALLGNWSGNEENQDLHNGIIRAATQVHERLQEVSWGLRGDLRYPFDHADGEITLEKFAVPHMPDRDAVGDIFNAAAVALDKLFPLYGRVVGRLVLAAEQVEAAIGLKPLSDLPDEKPAGETKQLTPHE